MCWHAVRRHHLGNLQGINSNKSRISIRYSMMSLANEIPELCVCGTLSCAPQTSATSQEFDCDKNVSPHAVHFRRSAPHGSRFQDVILLGCPGKWLGVMQHHLDLGLSDSGQFGESIVWARFRGEISGADPCVGEIGATLSPQICVLTWGHGC